MFTINVEVDVNLSTGSKIMLTPEQKNDVKNYVLTQILGAKKEQFFGDINNKTTTKKITRRTGYSSKQWSDGELAVLEPLVERYYTLNIGARSKDRTKDIKQLQKTFLPHRTQKQIYSKLYTLCTERRNKKTPNFQGFRAPFSVPVNRVN